MAGEAIFIGYRRDDTADVAGRIYDAMVLRFGRQRIFKDVDNIGPGVDFGDYIKTVLPRCRVALVLIGPHWLNSKDDNGRRRIDDEHDWVRIEIERALATPDLLVVPVLVNGASMPRSEDVPESLKPLLRRNAAIIRRDPDFHDDVERLAVALRASVNSGIIDLSKLGGKAGPAQGAPLRAKGSRAPVLIGGAIAAALALLAIGFGASRWLPIHPPLADAEQAAPAPSDASDVGRTQPSTQQSSPETQPEGPLPTPPVQSRRVFRDCRPDCPFMAPIPGQTFAAGLYEVTFAEWDECVSAGGCNGYRPSDQGWGRGDRPVINVSWNDAQAYVRWLSERSGQRYRLLTSAEWEIAARAGAGAAYSWGDQDPVCDQNASNGANFIACEDDRTRPVGSFQPNAFGLFDMHGNVWEWVEDCFDASCANRMLRGGSSDNYPELLRADARLRFQPDGRTYGSGFRVARTLDD